MVLYKRRRTARVPTVRIAPKKRRKPKKTTTNLVSRVMSYPLPHKLTTKLRYCTSVTLDPGIATVAYSDIRANGLFDPEAPAGGGQPLGFDQMVGTTSSTGFYQHYKVLGSKLKATFMAYTEGIGDNYVVGVNLVSDEVYPDSSVYSQLENGDGRHKFLTKFGGSKDVVTVMKNYSCKKFSGEKHLGDHYQGSRTSLPSEQHFFHIWAGAINPGDNPGPVNVLIDIEFIAEFYEPKDIARS